MYADDDIRRAVFGYRVTTAKTSEADGLLQRQDRVGRNSSPWFQSSNNRLEVRSTNLRHSA